MIKIIADETNRIGRISRFVRRLVLSHIFIKGVVTGRTGRYLVRGERRGGQEGGSNYRRRTSFGVPPSLLCEKTGTDLNLYYLASPLNTFPAKEISIYLRKLRRRTRKMNAPAAKFEFWICRDFGEREFISWRTTSVYLTCRLARFVKTTQRKN